MLFNSLSFLIYFPVVTMLYFAIPHGYRRFLLLSASCIFYMAFIPVYILILIFTIFVDYFAGIFIENASGRARKVYLVFSILANVGVLAVFKYYNFFIDNVDALAGIISWNCHIPSLSIILPIGLSFHTFQAMSYTIEVYRGRYKAERNFIIYALYVMFYPQLVAGPIERPHNLIHQFYEEHRFECERVAQGLKLMLWGMFIKVAIADRLAVYVNQVYSQPAHYSGLPLMIATVFFAFQIYCDFSGYSDIAIGAAQVMGFELMQNFDRPYFSRSVSEFWSRWHISLSTWFRDYFYISLGGNRVPAWRWYLNLFLTFLVSGLWHGANWTFVVWGGLNGFYLIFAIWTRQIRQRCVERIGLSGFPKVYTAFQIACTFSLISVSWIFFRARNMTDALYILTHLFSGVYGDIMYALSHISGLRDRFSTVFNRILLGWNHREFLAAVTGIAALWIVEWFQSNGDIRDTLFGRPRWFRWMVYYSILGLILKFGVFGMTQFIYFQF